jgi:hypothetical protein
MLQYSSAFAVHINYASAIYQNTFMQEIAKVLTTLSIAHRTP